VSEMVARAAAAASNAWHECDTCPGEMYVKEARIIARAALLAALDPEDVALEAVVDRGLDGVPSARSAIAAIRDYISAQGERRLSSDLRDENGSRG